MAFELSLYVSSFGSVSAGLLLLDTGLDDESVPDAEVLLLSPQPAANGAIPNTAAIVNANTFSAFFIFFLHSYNRLMPPCYLTGAAPSPGGSGAALQEYRT